MSHCDRNGQDWPEFCAEKPSCPSCQRRLKVEGGNSTASMKMPLPDTGFQIPLPDSGFQMPIISNIQNIIAEMVLRLDSMGISNQEALDMAVDMRMEMWNLDTADIIHLAISRRSRIGSIEDVQFLQKNLVEHSILLDGLGRTYEADINRNIVAGFDVIAGKGTDCHPEKQEEQTSVTDGAHQSGVSGTDQPMEKK